MHHFTLSSFLPSSITSHLLPSPFSPCALFSPSIYLFPSLYTSSHSLPLSPASFTFSCVFSGSSLVLSAYFFFHSLPPLSIHLSSHLRTPHLTFAISDKHSFLLSVSSSFTQHPLSYILLPLSILASYYASSLPLPSPSEAYLPTPIKQYSPPLPYKSFPYAAILPIPSPSCHTFYTSPQHSYSVWFFAYLPLTSPLSHA